MRDPDEDDSLYCSRCLGEIDRGWLIDNDGLGQYLVCPQCRRDLAVIGRDEMQTERAIRRADAGRE